MKKIYRDLFKLIFSIIGFLFIGGFLIEFIGFVIDHSVGKGNMLFNDLIGLNEIIVIFIGSLIMIGSIFFQARKRTDPYRFSRSMHAFFELNNEQTPEAFKNNLSQLLQKEFYSCSINDGEIRCVWPKSGNLGGDGEKVFGKGLNETRILTVKTLPDHSGKIRIEVIVEPKIKVRVIDSGNNNLKAINEFIQIMNWSHYQIEVDDCGLPVWKE